jgi:hypothetical protein
MVDFLQRGGMGPPSRSLGKRTQREDRPEGGGDGAEGGGNSRARGSSSREPEGPAPEERQEWEMEEDAAVAAEAAEGEEGANTPV